MPTLHAWDVPGSLRSMLYRTPNGMSVRVTHVGHDANAYPFHAQHYIGPVASFIRILDDGPAALRPTVSHILYGMPKVGYPRFG